MSSSKIWRLYSPFRSSTNVQQFLSKCYQANNIEDASKISFDNCYPFIYYLEHGQNFYELAEKASLSIKPILIFYGMVQLLKACLLTVNPQYPETTTVLAHGVSTRKRKKRNYEFLYDEVKIQKNGLFPHFSKKMFHVEQLEAEKFTMEHLFRSIPELNQLFEFSTGKTNHYIIGSVFDKQLQIPSQILDDLKMTFDRFYDYLKKKTPFQFTMSKENNSQFTLFVKEDIQPIHCEPIVFHYYKQTYHIPRNKSYFVPFAEVMTHYLLLYNLSMICRYETEWWSDLLHTYNSMDYPFIQNFIELTIEKIPYLLFLFLQNKKRLFN